MNKQRRSKWIGRIVISFLIFEMFFGICIFMQEIYPKSWTRFGSYSQFVKVADWTAYEPTLPDSAHDLRYYYYEGYFSDISGYHATFSPEEYEWKKQRLVVRYVGTFSEVSKEKDYLDREKIKEYKVDFLDILLPVDKDNGRFYFLTQEVLPTETGIYSYEAVLCNDSTYEVIELKCRICE